MVGTRDHRTPCQEEWIARWEDDFRTDLTRCTRLDKERALVISQSRDTCWRIGQLGGCAGTCHLTAPPTAVRPQ